MDSGPTDDYSEPCDITAVQEACPGPLDVPDMWHNLPPLVPHLQSQQMQSPESTSSAFSINSSTHAPLRWLRLLTCDTTDMGFGQMPLPQMTGGVYDDLLSDRTLTSENNLTATNATIRPESREQSGPSLHNDTPELTAFETKLFRHFVRDLSSWIDLTDCNRSFATLVPVMALRDKGLMKAILALSCRHLSLQAVTDGDIQPSREMAVQYYNETLQYLQVAMRNDTYLRSEELLSTVLTVSTYEMIDGSNGGWERHLKGVFGIQRSQLIHGESGGLKQAIWWAWLRQDLWAAFRERRKIMSYYTLANPCSKLNCYELANRAVFLLGQCVNFASAAEIDSGKANLQIRVDRATFLRNSLEEWWLCFAPYRTQLPMGSLEEGPFEPIWIHPPFCSKPLRQISTFMSNALISTRRRGSDPQLRPSSFGHQSTSHLWSEGAS